MRLTKKKERGRGRLKTSHTKIKMILEQVTNKAVKIFLMRSRRFKYT